MLCPTHGVGSSFFYPIGNTPAVSLLSHQPAEKEASDILLLACGDVRNILYTVFCDQNDTFKSKKLVFTCCDVEPAILARNVMLLSWLIDDTPLDDTVNMRNWAAYYSIVIDRTCFEAIRERATLLVENSVTLSAWHNSKYGRILRMANDETLANVRQYWVKYCGLTELPRDKLDDVRVRFMKEMRSTQHSIFTKDANDIGFSSGAIRATGAPCIYVMDTIAEAFNAFWKTGVIAGLPEFTEDATFINPLFVYSNVGGDRCVVNYGADPLQGFHCATAFAEMIDSPFDSLGQYHQNAATQENVHRFAKTAILEFKMWSSAFQSVASLNPDAVTIYNVLADALEFCYAMQSALAKIEPDSNIFQSCAAPWNTKTLQLQADCEFIGPFDVIDTSNVADYVGMLNLLVCALPLLKSGSNAVLYSESLSCTGGRSSPLERLRLLLCGDPATIFCFLRAAPMECLTGISTSCSLQEEVGFAMSERAELQQLRWRLSWKNILVGDERASTISKCPLIPSWESTKLAQKIVDIYTEMFENEEASAIGRTMKNGPMRKNYTRAGFVAFLKYIRSRHHTDNWADVSDLIIDLLSRDPMSMKALGLQELILHLHLQRLHTSKFLREPVKDFTISIPDSWPDEFRKSPLLLTLPLLFRIPRRHFQKVAKEFNPFTVSTHIVLQVGVNNGRFLNNYSVIQIAFADDSVHFPSKWRNSQDLIVHLYVPLLTTLMDAQNSPRISLRLQPEMYSAVKFRPILGPELIIFETDIGDIDHVVPLFTPRYPPVPTEVSTFPNSVSGSGFRISAPKLIDVDHQIEATTRIDVTGTNRTWLATGNEVESEQMSPCTFCLTLGKPKIEFVLPFPSEHSTSRIRIARKSGWIEVITRFAIGNSASFNFPSTPITHEGHRPFSWNLPRLSSPRLLPQLQLKTSNDLCWINSNVSSCFSARERVIRERLGTNDFTSGNTLVDLKNHIFQMFILGAGVGHRPFSKVKRENVFLLTLPGSGVMTIIFFAAMRLELADSTIVAESYVLPLVPELVKSFTKELTALIDIKNAATFPCTTESYELWKTYIKASIERSRAWHHQSDCTMVRQDKSRMTNDLLQPFLCRCGAGKDSEEFEKVKQWKIFSPFVTRCLFTPLFPVQCMEPLLANDFQKMALAVSGQSISDERCFTCNAKERLGTGEKLLKCKRCGKATYCSRECQKKDWKNHKASCSSA